MSEQDDQADRAPGEDAERLSVGQQVRGYVIGLAAAGVLTLASFTMARWGLIWEPGIPAALVALAIGQMGVHLVFFLHVTSGPDNTNNVLALAFGVLIVGLVLVGTLWIMANLSHHIMPMHEMMDARR